jgi:hypothetical protein
MKKFHLISLQMSQIAICDERKRDVAAKDCGCESGISEWCEDWILEQKKS